MTGITKEKDAELPAFPDPKPAEVQNITTDAVFGEITEDGPNYRNVCALPASPDPI